jgi:hypothetical protein
MPLPPHRIGLVDAGQGAVGEHHAEAERVVGPVALEDRHRDGRVGPPDQGGEEQAAGPAPDDGDVGRHTPDHMTNWRRPSRE